MATSAIEATVAFTVDDREVTVATWSDMSALLTIRLLARHPAPPRGCESGLCGSCESLVDGRLTRLCQMRSLDLDGCTVVTG